MTFVRHKCDMNFFFFSFDINSTSCLSAHTYWFLPTNSFLIRESHPPLRSTLDLRTFNPGRMYTPTWQITLHGRPTPTRPLPATLRRQGGEAEGGRTAAAVMRRDGCEGQPTPLPWRSSGRAATETRGDWRSGHGAAGWGRGLRQRRRGARIGGGWTAQKWVDG